MKRINHPQTRRRFIAMTAILAGTAALPGTASASGSAVAKWRGLALGADASLLIAGLNQAEAGPLFARMESELDRLENIFSLYRPHSALSRLNRDGRLTTPPGEFLELLSITNAVHARTDGAFDPTVQPLWSLYAAAAQDNTMPSHTEVLAAQARVGWQSVRFDSDRIMFDRPDMAMTLNGIAQGYVTDRIAALLRSEGLQGVLVDMGEIRAIGQRPGGGAWRAGLRTPEGGVFPERVILQNRALATSAPAATLLDAAGRIGHIFDPRTGRPAGQWRQVSVSAETAALADGLATAFCMMDKTQIALAAEAFNGVTVEKLVV
ncbi:MAG: FAD:protein FMN transferase [Rhodobacterales bacterium]